MSAKADFGMIGLAVMGRNLALNIEDHGFQVAVWNLETPAMEKGQLVLPTKPGLGLKFDEKQLAAYRVG